MRVLMNNYAANKQRTSCTIPLSFGKAPLADGSTLLDNTDIFVKQVGTLYRQSDSNDKIRIVGAIHKQLSVLYTQLQQPFLERLRTIESIKNEIGLYKKTLASFQLPV